MTKLVCLHLSDLHIGDPRFNNAWVNVGQALSEDINRICAKAELQIDLVVFTGDMVFSGSQEEFVALDILLDRLAAAIPTTTACRFVAVPGNHDLQRFETSKRIDHIGSSLCQRWGDYAEGFWLGKDPDSIEYIRDRFQCFTEWQRRRADLLLSPSLEGMLPGDATYTINKDGILFGFLTLNTAFLQLREGEFKGKLDLSSTQYAKATPDSSTAWNAAHQFSVLLTHHPLDWLLPETTRAFESELLSRFTCHMYGHMHEPKAISTSIDGGGQRLSFQAASLCGIDRVGGKTAREHGYSLFEFHADKSGPEFIRYWSRRYGTHGNKGSFIANPSMEFVEGTEYLDIFPPGSKPKVVRSRAGLIAGTTVFRRSTVVGRNKEIDKIIECLQSDSIVCLKGFGGVGKTAIAKEVVATMNCSYQWIDVHEVDPDNASALVEKILERFARPEDAIASEGAAPPPSFEQLIELLPVNQLLVLDGFSLISQDASRFLIQLSERRTDIRILTTSWGQIHSMDVPIIQIHPLGVVDQGTPIEIAIASPAARMFVVELHRHRENFVLDSAAKNDILTIVRAAGGVPLAIKLIASIARRRPLAWIKNQLINGDKLNHNESLDQCFDQCFQLLSDKGKNLLFCLALFPASFSLDHAQCLAGDDSLDELLDSSFVEFDDVRYGIHRLLREYARREAIKAGHRFSADQLIDLAIRCQIQDSMTRGERSSESEFQEHLPADATERLTPDDWQNALVILERLLEDNVSAYHISRLASAVNRWLRDIRQWNVRLSISTRTLAALAYEENGPNARYFAISGVWLRAAILECRENTAAEPRQMLSDYVDFISAIDKMDESVEWTPSQHENLTFAKVVALQRLVGVNKSVQRFSSAELLEIATEFLSTQKSSPVRARILSILSALHQQAGDTAAAVSSLRDALANSGLSPFQIAHCRDNLGRIYLSKGNFSSAALEFEHNESSSHPEIVARALAQHAEALSRSGEDLDRATELFYRSIAERSRLGNHRGVGITKSVLSNHLRRVGRASHAMQEVNEAINLLSGYPSLELARAYLSRATFYADACDFKSALSDNQNAHRIHEGLKHLDQLIAVDRIASTYESAGDLTQAGQWFLKSVAMLSDTKFRAVDRRNACLNANRFASKHGSVLNDPGFDKRLKQAAEQLGIMHFLSRIVDDVNDRSYQSEAFHIRLAGRRIRKDSSWDELIDFYVSLTDQCGAERPLRQALFLNELASAYKNRGDFDLCILSAKRALKIFEDAGLNAGIASANHKLGDVYLESAKGAPNPILRQRVSDAILHYEKSIEIKRRFIPIENTGLRISLIGLAEAHQLGDTPDRACQVYEDALLLTGIKGKGKGKALLQKSLDLFVHAYPEFKRRLLSPSSLTDA